MILVDTGAWYAMVIESDPDHQMAADWFKQNTEQLAVTDYIIDELLTLLRSRGAGIKAIELGEIFFETDDVVIHVLTGTDLRNSWRIYREYQDKEWSFTDCSSKYICEKYGITKAVSFDRHFRQFGSVTVLP